MKMQATVILTAATVSLALENVASAGIRECEADHECDKGYCYPDTGRCVMCVNCSSILRQPSPWRTCAKDPEDCGECLPGFEYSFLTDGITRGYCVPKKKNESGIFDVRNPYFWLIITSAVGLLILLVFVIHKIYKALSKNRMGGHNSNEVEDPLPLIPANDGDNLPAYDSCFSSLNRHSAVSSSLENSLTVIEKKENPLQQAVPFIMPDPPYGNGRRVEEDDDDDDEDDGDDDDNDGNAVPEEWNEPCSPSMNMSVDNEEPRAISPPPLEDENTMPSNWTPYSGSVPSVPEEPPCEEESSVTSSLSNVSDLDTTNGPSVQEVLNDSGVSASCSRNSDLSNAHGDEELHELTSGQGTSTNNIRLVSRRHSDEDLSTLAEMGDRKRQRRDSGSSSMISVETYIEKVN